jgi:serine-type D-Ala-D-Ala carboxypeptidase/endopeptidase (penicillin-binding protein 4)
MALLFSMSVSALEKKWLEKAQSQVSQIIEKSKIAKKDLAIFIAENNDNVVIDINSEKKMIPASITKIATAATVIGQMPSGNKFITQLLSPAKVEGSVLKGDLYLKGGGDPSFVSESMWFLVNAFYRAQIKVIEGDIVVDDLYFDRLRIDPSREDNRVDRAYDAPTGAMSFNWNSINIFVRPGKKVGESAQVFADPESEYIRLRANVRTVGKSEKNEIIVEREENKQGDGDVVTVNGKISEASNEVVIYKNITQPDIWSGYNLKSFLKQRGIEVRGRVRSSKTPDEAKVLAEQESKPIELILTDMNKFSNNYVAEMLTKNISARIQPPGTIAKGVEIIRAQLLKIGLQAGEFDIVNPSGLTRENRFTARGLWKVTQYLRDQFQYSPEFATSLPIAGVDGTLKKRMKDTAAERWVRGKTGLLTSVVSLAGYIGRKDGSVLPFVMMYNGSADEGSVRSLYDKICITLAE